MRIPTSLNPYFSYPLGNAIDIVAEEMTDNVTFEVENVELVYSAQPKTDEDGYVDIENREDYVYPEWMLTLYNPNDMLTYMCYVRLEDGTFRYYTVESDITTQ